MDDKPRKSVRLICECYGEPAGSVMALYIEEADRLIRAKMAEPYEQEVRAKVVRAPRPRPKARG